MLFLHRLRNGIILDFCIVLRVNCFASALKSKIDPVYHAIVLLHHPHFGICNKK